jgi:hypothetical protein
MADELDLECPICMEKFSSEVNIPKLLPCTHDVCDQCVESIMHCPVCRQPFSSNLGTNRTLLKAIKMIEKANSASRDASPINHNGYGMCASHRDSEASNYCWNHRRYVCKKCKESGSCRKCKRDVLQAENAVDARIQMIEASLPSEKSIESMHSFSLRLNSGFETVREILSNPQSEVESALEHMAEIQEFRKALNSLKFRNDAAAVMALQTLEENKPDVRNANLNKQELQTSIDLAIGALTEIRNDLRDLKKFEEEQKAPAPIPIPHSLAEEDLLGGILETENVWNFEQLMVQKCIKFFEAADKDGDGVINGIEAQDWFSKSCLPAISLKQIWSLADLDKSNSLNLKEFVIAMHLTMLVRKTPSLKLPSSVPRSALDRIGSILYPTKELQPDVDEFLF